MYLKIIGMICIIAGTTSLGIKLSQGYKERLKLLIEYKRILNMLDSEIQFNNSLLGESMLNISKNTTGVLGDLLMETGNTLMNDNCISFNKLWSELVDKYLSDSSLVGDDLKNIKELGSDMGSMNKNMQRKFIILNIEKLEMRIQDARGKFMANGKLCKTLGVLMGIMICIMLA